ncbi:MAG: glycosyltransferase [Bdellovibrionaceae bacterium]|nr:glycosyltransferase [Pseudobdellovibrionaceae bacterium]
MIVQASNIHEGGGLVLLKELLPELCKSAQVTLFVDARFLSNNKISMQNTANLNVVSVNPTIICRLKSEFQMYFLSKHNPEATVFCFGNLPPLLPIKNRVLLYFHTVLYFKPFLLTKKRFFLKIKHLIERAWLTWGLTSVKEVIVQSSFVKESFEREFGFSNITVFPFTPTTSVDDNTSPQSSTDKNIDFVYLAAGTAHKNHDNLIKAWNLLAHEQIFPTLHLTIDSRYSKILSAIEASKNSHKTNIINHGMIPHNQAMVLYKKAKAIIFPSICESFGLPLLEAKSLDIPILASELDYVRDLVDPIESFDPNSSKSIARAVKRFLTIRDNKNQVRTVAELTSYLKN